MGQLRIRWGWLARGAGVLAGVLVALQVLPDLLAPPEAPPLAADVGLPRVGRGEVEEALPKRAVPAWERELTPRPKPRPSRGISAATAVIGSTPRRHREGALREGRGRKRDEARARPPRPTRPPPALPPPPATPAPGPEPAPAAVAPAPPPAPEDGSMEFAPR